VFLLIPCFFPVYNPRLAQICSSHDPARFAAAAIGSSARGGKPWSGSLSCSRPCMFIRAGKPVPPRRDRFPFETPELQRLQHVYRASLQVWQEEHILYRAAQQERNLLRRKASRRQERAQMAGHLSMEHAQIDDARLELQPLPPVIPFAEWLAQNPEKAEQVKAAAAASLAAERAQAAATSAAALGSRTEGDGASAQPRPQQQPQSEGSQAGLVDLTELLSQLNLSSTPGPSEAPALVVAPFEQQPETDMMPTHEEPWGGNPEHEPETVPLPPILQKAAKCTLLAAAPGTPPPVFILSLDRAVAFDRLCTNIVKGYRGAH